LTLVRLATSTETLAESLAIGHPTNRFAKASTSAFAATNVDQ
jgi:hypothetical protein